jgi:hypothetical protein
MKEKTQILLITIFLFTCLIGLGLISVIVFHRYLFLVAIISLLSLATISLCYYDCQFHKIEIEDVELSVREEYEQVI